MVAVRREIRQLKHVSKPLREQMKHRVDRTRWPVLITYSDESVGHNGYVYQCSGWTKTERNLVDTYTVNGKRVSRYANGATKIPAGAVAGKAWIQRWEHHIDPDPAAVFDAHWVRVAIPGKVWRSGQPAYRYDPTSKTPQLSLAI